MPCKQHCFMRELDGVCSTYEHLSEDMAPLPERRMSPLPERRWRRALPGEEPSSSVPSSEEVTLQEPEPEDRLSPRNRAPASRSGDIGRSMPAVACEDGCECQQQREKHCTGRTALHEGRCRLRPEHGQVLRCGY
jgi:hypothetical protein